MLGDLSDVAAKYNYSSVDDMFNNLSPAARDDIMKMFDKPLGSFDLKTESKFFKNSQVDEAVEGGSTFINPNNIRYSQSSVNGSSDIIQSMRKNGWIGEPIDVVEMPDGVHTTIDNTRVVSAREAGIDVKANVHRYDDPLPSEYIERFTTKKGTPKTWGEAIELRVGKQKASFRNENPYGKFNMETVN